MQRNKINIVLPQNYQTSSLTDSVLLQSLCLSADYSQSAADNKLYTKNLGRAFGFAFFHIHNLFITEQTGNWWIHTSPMNISHSLMKNYFLINIVIFELHLISYIGENNFTIPTDRLTLTDWQTWQHDTDNMTYPTAQPDRIAIRGKSGYHPQPHRNTTTFFKKKNFFFYFLHSKNFSTLFIHPPSSNFIWFHNKTQYYNHKIFWKIIIQKKIYPQPLPSRIRDTLSR